jgi:GGDEF domain-containing protein
VLGECPHDAAELKRLELQERVEQIVINVDATAVQVGVSAGAAVYPHDGHTCDALLAAADRRMYSDKAARRRTPAATSAGTEVRRASAANVPPPSEVIRPS